MRYKRYKGILFTLLLLGSISQITGQTCTSVQANDLPDLCTGDSVNLNQSIVTGTGAFSIISGPIGYSYDPFTNIFKASDRKAGNYQIAFLTNQNNCNNSDTFSLNIRPFPATSITPNPIPTLCENQSLTLTANYTNGSSFEYKWSTGETSQSITTDSLGTYWVTMKIGSCADTDHVTLAKAPEIAVQLSPDTSICTARGEHYQVLVNHNTDNPIISWNTTGLPNEEVAIVNTAPIDLVVTITDNNGCTGSDSVSISELCPPPSIKTANMLVIDGSPNSIWQPFGSFSSNDFITSHFEVYNRWGNQIIATNDLPPKWDGTEEGKPCASGVYFWIWHYQTIQSNEKQEMNGFIQLLNHQ